MEKTRSSPLSFLFPWLSPLVISFSVVNGGIVVQLYRNNRLIPNWHPSKLRRVLPEQLIQWMENYHIHAGPQPYPLVKQLWHYLLPLVSKKLFLDSSVLAQFEEVSQPLDFALVWTLDRSSERVEGRYEGADRYLGMGWFQTGTKIWPLNTPLSSTADAQLKNLIVPVQQAASLLNSIIPHLQQYLPTRADFELIANFVPQVIVRDASSKGLTLSLQCNYPQLLPTIKVPQQKADVLLANQAIIQFSQQALTPVMAYLLQSGSSIAIEGAGVPLFISDELPILRQHHEISDDMVAKITQAHPIVSVATLRPTSSIIHAFENGVGKYVITASYQYQQQTLDMDALLAAHQQSQRFVQQHGIWFEWPSNAHMLVKGILQQRTKQVLLFEEVMGFEMRRIAQLPGQPTAHTIEPAGKTPGERAHSLFEQLRYHGIPGGIVNDPTGLVTMFVKVCEAMLRDHRQARILWVVPSNKKGSVTRAVNASTISSYVTVASLVTLRDEPVLFSHSWTLVIFQGLDLLLDGSPLSLRLAQFSWQWALFSLPSKRALNPSMLRVLHLPERYHGQFEVRYLFDLEKSSSGVVTGTGAPPLSPAQRTAPTAPKKDAVSRLTISPVSSSALQAEKVPRLTVQLHPEASRKPEQLRRQSDINAPIKATPDSTKPRPTSPRPAVELNQKKIARLHEESEQLQERLIVDDEEVREEHILVTPIPNPVPDAPPLARKVIDTIPEIDEDWKEILQQWQPEHWDVLLLLYQEHSAQLAMVERRVHRPISRLIDEINLPVDEQLGDLLVDPDTRTIASHLHSNVEILVRWYLSSRESR